MSPETTPAPPNSNIPVVPAATVTAPAAPAAPKIAIPTAKAAGTAAQPEARLLSKSSDGVLVHDVTPLQNDIHRVTLPPAKVLALLAQLDPDAPQGKLAEKVQVQVGPNGEWFLTVTYKA